MKIKSQEEILDLGTRKLIIDEMIDGQENLDRKLCELRKHEIYRDLNSKWVMEGIRREAYKESTIQQMANRASNISVARKIVDKKAITYAGGVERVVADEQSQQSIGDLVRELDFNTNMKKTDKYRELFHNTMVYTVPVISSRYSVDRLVYDICMKVLAPWEYDVVEDCYDPTKPLCLILTSFPEQNQYAVNATAQPNARGGGATSAYGDNRDQAIADTPNDKDTSNQDKREFVWWTDKYHFTTNIGGEIIGTPYVGNDVNAILNPIGVLPAVNVAQGQDGAFWAKGGDDLVDGSVWVNKTFTDLNFIMFVQGWGQMVITGSNIPKNLTGGPDNAMMFETKEGEPTPTVSFASSNPPVEAWLESIRSYIAMLLSTNNLASSAIATKLDISTAQSGISKIIEQAELTTDLQDVQQLFKDVEPDVWEIIKRWHALYASTSSLVPDLQAIPPFKDSDVQLKFMQLMPPISEREKLEAMKLRKDLGIATKKDLLMMDNPSLTEEEIDKKLLELKEQGETNAEETEETQEAEEDKDAKNVDEQVLAEEEVDG